MPKDVTLSTIAMGDNVMSHSALLLWVARTSNSVILLRVVGVLLLQVVGMLHLVLLHVVGDVTQFYYWRWQKMSYSVSGKGDSDNGSSHLPSTTACSDEGNSQHLLSYPLLQSFLRFVAAHSHLKMLNLPHCSVNWKQTEHPQMWYVEILHISGNLKIYMRHA